MENVEFSHIPNLVEYSLRFVHKYDFLSDAHNCLPKCLDENSYSRMDVPIIMFASIQYIQYLQTSPL